MRRHHPPVARSRSRRTCDALPDRPEHPTGLWATQPWLVRHHAAYYGTGKWEQTGATSADMHKSYNRYPVITVEPDGRHVIRAGHHRSFAALVAGRDVWARVIRAVDKAQEQGLEEHGSSEAETPELVVTPHLRVHAPSSEPMGLDERSARIAAGSVVAVETTDAAARLLARVGFDPQQIDDRLSMALTGQIGSDR